MKNFGILLHLQYQEIENKEQENKRIQEQLNSKDLAYNQQEQNLQKLTN